MEYKLYNILNVSKNSTQTEIKKAYKKLAIKYHPDKNIDNKEEAEKKFQEISYAYKILSDPDKRRSYNISGDNQDNIFVDNVNPFEMFNNIFQNHVNRFMDFNTQNSNLHNLINKLRENGSHIYTGFYNMNNEINNNMNKMDKMNKMNNIKTKNNIPDYEKVNTKFIKKTNKVSNKKVNKKKTTLDKKDGKPEIIVIEVESNIEEIYMYKKKNITIPITNVKEKKIDIPLVGKEIVINNIGKEDIEYKEKGDVKIIVKIVKKDGEKNYDRIGNYNLLIKKNISIYDFYHKNKVKVILPDKSEEEIIYNYKEMIEMNEFNIKIINKGFPYLHNKKRGLLIVKINILLPIDYNDLLKNLKNN
jgi:DnaJ-class molecular chaperone